MSYTYIIKSINNITNAQKVKKKKINLLYSNFLLKILTKLKEKKYIKDVIIKKKNITVYLKYNNMRRPLLNKFIFISKPSLRIYKKIKELKIIKMRNQECIITTNRGLLDINEAIELKTGGELLFFFY
ncbi:30S ribosomal protein S8 [Candidatus Vidania fulgoroideorum]